MPQNKWELKEHEAHWEITNGHISLCTREDDVDEPSELLFITDALNTSGIELHSENKLELDQHIEIIKLQDRVNRLVNTLECIVNAPVPANEREYVSWFVTAKNIAGGAISGMEADKFVSEYNQSKGGEKV